MELRNGVLVLRQRMVKHESILLGVKQVYALPGLLAFLSSLSSGLAYTEFGCLSILVFRLIFYCLYFPSSLVVWKSLGYGVMLIFVFLSLFLSLLLFLFKLVIIKSNTFQRKYNKTIVEWNG